MTEKSKKEVVNKDVNKKEANEEKVNKEDVNKKTANEQNVNNEVVNSRLDEWMLKPCDWYLEEYKECKCTKARFNQYFIYGELLNCKQWKIDHDNCEKWQKHDDDEAYNMLLASEKDRRYQRMKSHVNNDIWTKRDRPPENWNVPLPEWMQKQQENTYLDLKQKGLESGNINDLDLKIPWCTIL